MLRISLVFWIKSVGKHQQAVLFVSLDRVYPLAADMLCQAGVYFTADKAQSELTITPTSPFQLLPQSSAAISHAITHTID